MIKIKDFNGKPYLRVRIVCSVNRQGDCVENTSFIHDYESETAEFLTHRNHIVIGLALSLLEGLADEDSEGDSIHRIYNDDGEPLLPESVMSVLEDFLPVFPRQMSQYEELNFHDPAAEEVACIDVHYVDKEGVCHPCEVVPVSLEQVDLSIFDNYRKPDDTAYRPQE